MINLIFDATILTSIYEKNAGRSGVFFASLNIFKGLIARKELNVAMYASPKYFAEFKRLKKDFFPQIPDLYVKSCNKYVFEIYFWLKYKYASLISRALIRKPFALALRIIHRIISYRASKFINYDVIDEFDVFFSPVYGIPQEILRKQIKKCYMLYDAIPLKFPEYYPGGSFLNDIRREGKQEDLFFFDSRSSYNDFKDLFPFVSKDNSCVVHLAADAMFHPCLEKKKMEKCTGKIS